MPYSQHASFHELERYARGFPPSTLARFARRNPATAKAWATGKRPASWWAVAVLRLDAIEREDTPGAPLSAELIWVHFGSAKAMLHCENCNDGPLASEDLGFILNPVSSLSPRHGFNPPPLAGFFRSRAF